MTRHFTGKQSFAGDPTAPEGTLQSQHGGADAASLAESLPNANLVVVGGPNDGLMVPIPTEGLTMGRLHDNDVVVDDPWVSRNHAEIVPSHDSFMLRDLASSNGTYLTDRLISTSDYGLQDGDHIRLGQSDVQLVFRFSGAATLKMAPGAVLDVGPVADAPNTPARARKAPKRGKTAPDLAWPDGLTVRDEKESSQEPVEGDVRLNIEAAGDLRLMYQFVHELRQRPEFRVLRLSGGPGRQLSVWIGLVERLPLALLLSSIKFVSNVSQGERHPSGGQKNEKVFNVYLAV